MKSSYPRQYIYVCEDCFKSVYAVAVDTGPEPHVVRCPYGECYGRAPKELGPIVPKKKDPPQWELCYQPGLSGWYALQGMKDTKILVLRKRTKASPDLLDYDEYQELKIEDE